MTGLFSASIAAYIPNVTFSRISVTNIPNHHKGGAGMTEGD